MNEYYVLAVVLVIFIGIWAYLWNLDLRLQKMKKEFEVEHDETERR